MKFHTRILQILRAALTSSVFCIVPSLAFSSDTILQTDSQNKSTTVWLGSEIGERSQFGFAGFVTAINGNIHVNDVLIRVSGAFGEYDYDSAGNKIDVDQTTGDIMIGYHDITNTHISSIYAGLAFQDNDLSISDPSNSTSGSKTGYKVQGEYVTRGNEDGFISLIGHYSSVNEEYYARARLGFNIGDGIHIGPAATLLGNTEFDGTKIGGFISGIRLGDLNLSLNAGQASSNNEDVDDTFYAGVSVSFQF